MILFSVFSSCYVWFPILLLAFTVPVVYMCAVYLNYFKLQNQLTKSVDSAPLSQDLAFIAPYSPRDGIRVDVMFHCVDMGIYVDSDLKYQHTAYDSMCDIKVSYWQQNPNLMVCINIFVQATIIV